MTDQPRIRLFAMAAAYNDGQGQGTVVSGTWLAWNEQCACGEFVSKYYIEGGKFPLTGVAALEIAPEQLRRLLDILDKNEPTARGEVVRLVPKEETTADLAGLASDNLRPAPKFRCRWAPAGGAPPVDAPCSGIPSAFCPSCLAVAEEASPDPA